MSPQVQQLERMEEEVGFQLFPNPVDHDFELTFHLQN